MIAARRGVRRAAGLVGLVHALGLGVGACGSKAPSAPPTAGSATTAPTPHANVPADATSVSSAQPNAANSDAELNQQVQNLSNSLTQVSGDLTNADKATANGG